MTKIKHRQPDDINETCGSPLSGLTSSRTLLTSRMGHMISAVTSPWSLQNL